ncbi:MAG: MoxR family ATPase [Planctomycetaceae bacterium]|nr:MoxR family ATPase [Planctomycetaceae bacterium]
MRDLMTCASEFSGGWQSVCDASERPALPTTHRFSFVRRKINDNGVETGKQGECLKTASPSHENPVLFPGEVAPDKGLPLVSEVIVFDSGFVPQPGQVVGRNVLYRAADVLAGSDLLDDKEKKNEKFDFPGFRLSKVPLQTYPATHTGCGIETDAMFLERMALARKQIIEQVERVVVGQKSLLNDIMIALVARGHCLLEGVPGLAKTSLVAVLAKLCGMQFHHITLTPDTLPEDITKIERAGKSGEKHVAMDHTLSGPLLANVVFAGEINRTPPKTQAALLETLQEKKSGISSIRYPLSNPFFIVATENPIEQSGVFPLTSMHRDLFMMKLIAGYPAFDEECEMVRKNPDAELELSPVISIADLLRWQKLAAALPASDEVTRFAVDLVRQTRADEHGGQHDFVSQQVAWGASPHATQHLLMAAKTRAIFSGRTSVARQDVVALLKPVLRHRLVMQSTASLLADQVIEQLD